MTIRRRRSAIFFCYWSLGLLLVLLLGGSPVLVEPFGVIVGSTRKGGQDLRGPARWQRKINIQNSPATHQQRRQSLPLRRGRFDRNNNGDNPLHPLRLSGARESNDAAEEKSSESSLPSLRLLLTFASKNFFLVGMVVAVGLARAFPAAGKNGGLLRPELFVGKYGVTTIFLLSGLSLELAQLKDAASNWKLNGLIQAMSFVAWPYLIGLPLTKLLATLHIFPQPLLDGLLILSCLPTTVNMCVILTANAGGNVASALCNAVMSNLMGIFATPALLFRFFGADIQLPFLEMLVKLSNMVLLPVAVGQALRATPAKAFYQSHSKFFKRLQEVILLSILWNAFCTAISSSNMGLGLRDGLGLLVLLPTVHLLSLGALFAFFSRLDFGRGEVVAALFYASQKTLAFGLPLINTIFQGNANVAAYCAPLMFIHPIQLILGSALLPSLQRFTSASDAGDVSSASKP